MRCIPWLAMLLLGCQASDAPEGLVSEAERAVLATLRYDESPPLLDPSNRVDGDPAARAFGQRLFFATELSGPLLDGDNDGSEGTLGRDGEPGRVACSGCHVPTGSFVDTRTRGGQASLAARWTMRRTPQLLDAAFAPLFNWDGRRDSLWAQAVGVMESDREFNSSRLFVAQQIFRLHRDEYESIFGPMPPLDEADRFPPLTPDEAGCELFPGLVLECRGKPGDGGHYDSMDPDDQARVTEVAVNVGKALAAFVAQLRCGPSRFDAWLDGDEEALTAAEQRGAALFVGRAGCIDCHDGPRLTDDEFHNVGLVPELVSSVVLDANDRGAAVGLAEAIVDPLNTRGPFSDGDREVLPAHVLPEHEGAFRTPSLRCISQQPSFMHTAQLRSLEEVVTFFDEREPLDLSPEERDDLVAFMRALEGDGPPDALRAPPP